MASLTRALDHPDILPVIFAVLATPMDQREEMFDRLWVARYERAVAVGNDIDSAAIWSEAVGRLSRIRVRQIIATGGHTVGHA